jgi:hypothetical protein
VISLVFCRRADAYAWFAALMMLVGVPLASLSIDVTRMMYVRGHLQTASDAACQAAVDALDVPHFIATGEARIKAGQGRSWAGQVFGATLTDSDQIGYSHGLAVDFPGPRFAHCTATATVDHIIPMTPAMHILVETTSEMRVRSLQ